MNAVAAPASSRLGQEYRLPRSYFWTGVVCAAFFFVVGVVSAWAAWTNIDGSFRHPKETAVIFGVFWGLFTLLGLFLVRAYLVERLLLWEDRVTVVGSFRTREVAFAEVERARWAFGLFAVLGAGLLGVGIADPFNDPVTRWQNIIFGTLTVVFGAYAFARVSKPQPPPGTGESAPKAP